MKKQSLIVAVLLSLTSIISAQIVIKQIMQSDLSQERAVFAKSWAATYKDCSLDQLGISDMALFLDEVFDIEEIKFQENFDYSKCYHALKGDKVVGYISYDVIEPGIAYIRQWCLLPDFSNNESLRELLFTILEYDESIHTMYADVRVVVENYRQMLEEFGFEECDVYSHYDSKLFVGLKFVFGDKCGTCLCDYTEEEFEAAPVFDIGFEHDYGCSELNEDEQMSVSPIE